MTFQDFNKIPNYGAAAMLWLQYFCFGYCKVKHVKLHDKITCQNRGSLNMNNIILFIDSIVSKTQIKN